ncbi:MAG: threonine/serine exporter family protein [Aeromicrobium erythreum]
MTETRETQRTLDLALRVGELLLSNGAGAADVTATMSSVTHHLGLRSTLVDVTFTTLTLSHQASPDEVPVTMRRHVTHRETDFADLTAVDAVVTRLLTDEIDREEAASRVAQIASSGHPRPRWAITLAWGFTAAGIALLLGGAWDVMLIAAVAGIGIEVLQRRIGRLRLPMFYAQAAGGLFATLLAVGLAAAEVPIEPSRAVAASIVMLLAGQGLVGAIQDALTGFYITANARVLEVMIATAGIIAGVGAGLSIGSQLGVDVQVDVALPGLSQAPTVVLGAGVCAAGFAFSAYSPIRVTIPMGVIGGASGGLYFVLVQHGAGNAAAAALAAVLLGLVSYPAAQRVRVPPLVLIVSGIVPLLPGLSIYRSLALLSQEDIAGILPMITAASSAIGLASGAILGEYIAQPLRREARRLEQRLAGPRLVGPLRARAVRRRDRPA